MSKFVGEKSQKAGITYTLRKREEVRLILSEGERGLSFATCSKNIKQALIAVL
jgi:hypothetical protein